MPRAYKSMLAYLKLVNDVPGYQEMEIAVPKDEDDSSKVVQWKESVTLESPATA